MQRIDAWIISKFESLAHKFQRLTGFDCFWLARQFAAVSIVLAFAVVLLAPIALGGPGLFPSLIYAWLGRIQIGVLLTGCGEAEKECADANEIGCSNPRKNSPHDGSVRRFAVPMFVIMLAYALLVRELFPALVALYFVADGGCEYLLACDPLPPCESKIKQWVKSFKAKPLVAAEQT